MLQNFFENILPNALSGISPVTFIIVYLGGVLTSFSPCIVTMVPVIIGYIGGYSEEHDSKFKGFLTSLSFVLGMSLTFAIFGVAAVLLGRVFGQVGKAWYYIISALAIIMGLHLLGVINLRFPSINISPLKKGGLFQAFLIGLTFGLVMSPCATPVLAVIITYVAATKNVLYGSGLLFVYGLGHGLPLIIAGTFTAAVKQMSRFQKFSHYVTLASGVMLIVLGLYFLALVHWY